MRTGNLYNSYHSYPRHGSVRVQYQVGLRPRLQLAASSDYHMPVENDQQSCAIVQQNQRRGNRRTLLVRGYILAVNNAFHLSVSPIQNTAQSRDYTFTGESAC